MTRLPHLLVVWLLLGLAGLGGGCTEFLPLNVDADSAGDGAGDVLLDGGPGDVAPDGPDDASPDPGPDVAPDATPDGEPDAPDTDTSDAGDTPDFGDSVDAGELGDLPDSADGDAGDAGDDGGPPDVLPDAEPDVEPDVAPDADVPGEDVGPTVIAPCEDGYVILGDEGLEILGAPWAPKMMGYQVDVRYVAPGGVPSWFLAPHWQTCADSLCCNSESECLVRLDDELARMKAMGFNAIRLAGLPFSHGVSGPRLDCTRISQGQPLDTCPALDLSKPGDLSIAEGLIEDLLDLAEARGFRVMISVGDETALLASNVNAHAGLLGTLAERFAGRTALFAWETVEEVAQAKPPTFAKQADMQSALQAFHDAIRATEAPQLITVGLTDATSTIGFDPLALAVDFLGYHPFPLGGFDAAREKAYNAELSWLATLGRPFMVTATGFASGGWGTESEQLAFAQKSMTTARDCGALGYGWWQFRDIHADPNRQFGAVTTNLVEKPVAAIFKVVDLGGPKGTCPALPTGLDPLGGGTFTITGRVIDGAGTGVSAARVTGWSCPVSADRFHTFAGPDGKYTLRSSAGLVQVTISAPGRKPLNTFPSCVSKDEGDKLMSANSATPTLATPTCD